MSKLPKLNQHICACINQLTVVVFFKKAFHVKLLLIMEDTTTEKALHFISATITTKSEESWNKLLLMTTQCMFASADDFSVCGLPIEKYLDMPNGIINKWKESLCSMITLRISVSVEHFLSCTVLCMAQYLNCKIYLRKRIIIKHVKIPAWLVDHSQGAESYAQLF